MRSRALVPLLLSAATLASCDLRFDSQRIEVAAFPEQDRVDCLLEYGGLYFTGHKPDEEQVARIDEVVRTQRIMAFDSWPFAITLAEVNDQTRGIAERFALEQGPLYVDENGQLATWHMVRITGCKALLGQLNELLRKELGERLEQQGKLLDLPVDAETKELLGRALEAKQAFLEQRKAALALCLPCSAAFHTMLRKKALTELLRTAAEAAASKAAESKEPLTAEAFLAQLPVRFLIENEIGITRLAGRTDIVLGLATSNHSVLVKPPAGEWRDDLKKALEKQGRELPRVAHAAIAQSFVEFQKRDKVGGGAAPASRPASGSAR